MPPNRVLQRAGLRTAAEHWCDESRREKRKTHGVVAVAVSGAIAALIYFGLATPHPELRAAYLICVGVGLWGLIDIARSLGAARSGSHK